MISEADYEQAIAERDALAAQVKALVASSEAFQKTANASLLRQYHHKINCCKDLAICFLSDPDALIEGRASDAQVDELAQRIQDAVENWFSEANL